MTGVQLIGTKAVLARVAKLDYEAWALYQGKSFIVGGIGCEELGEWLHDFDAAGSTATYTIRMYDGKEAPTSSNANSDYIASICFKVVDGYEGYGIAGHSNKLMERIGALEKQLKDQEEDKDGPGEDLNSVIMGWLNDPIKLGHVVGAIRQLMGGGYGVAEPAMIAAAPVQTISGTGTATNGITQPGANDDITRLSKSIDVLEKHDKKIVEHFEKLAKLAQTEPLLFNAVIAKLDAL